MDVTQRLDEIRQMRLGLMEIGVEPNACGNLLAALYFCDGVTALPVVIGQWQEDFIDEVHAGRQSLREAIEKVQTGLADLQVVVVNSFTHQAGCLHGLAEANQVEVQALGRLIQEGGGTDETIPDREEEPKHTDGWRDENRTTTQAADSGD